jgi:hypothetical protein
MMYAIEMTSDGSHLLTLVPARGFFYPEDGGDTFLRNIG